MSTARSAKPFSKLPLVALVLLAVCGFKLRAVWSNKVQVEQRLKASEEDSLNLRSQLRDFKETIHNISIQSVHLGLEKKKLASELNDTLRDLEALKQEHKTAIDQWATADMKAQEQLASCKDSLADAQSKLVLAINKQQDADMRLQALQQQVNAAAAATGHQQLPAAQSTSNTQTTATLQHSTVATQPPATLVSQQQGGVAAQAGAVATKAAGGGAVGTAGQMVAAGSTASTGTGNMAAGNTAVGAGSSTAGGNVAGAAVDVASTTGSRMAGAAATGNTAGGGVSAV